MLSIFSCSVGHLYILFGENLLKSFVLPLDFFLILLSCSLAVLDTSLSSSIWFATFFLPVYGLSFHFLKVSFKVCKLFFFFYLKILFIHERHRDRERQRHRQRGETGPMQGAQHGTLSRVSRVTPWAEGGAKPLSHQGCPRLYSLSVN